MNKILIIGGCGYIGSQLFNFLTKKGYDTSSVDLELFGNPDIPNLKENFKNLTKEYLSQYESIVLLAGHSSVKMCDSNMVGCFKNNVEYFIDLLTKLETNQKFIYASSSSVYGNVNRNIMTEECNEYIAGNFYDLSKAEIDYYCKIYNNINYYGLRFGTVNGFSDNIRNDIMINAMVSNAISNKEIKVFNPSVKRPILYINDLCRAIETIILKGKFENRGIYNLASLNSTVENIGRKVVEIFSDVKLTVIEDPNQLYNNNVKVYDFAISSDKFISTFDFQFEGTIPLIAKNVNLNFDKAKIIGNRNKEDIII